MDLFKRERKNDSSDGGGGGVNSSHLWSTDQVPGTMLNASLNNSCNKYYYVK